MKLAAISCAVLLGFIAVTGVIWWYHDGHDEIVVIIESGLTAKETAERLKSKGVIRSVRVFRAVAKLTGKDRNLKPGTYTLKRLMSAPSAIRLIHKGSVENIKVAIPEGFMAKQIADRLEASGITDSAEFMKYVRASNLEGFLFPTTYFFSKGLSAEAVAHYMHAEFDRRIDPIFASKKQDRFTLKQAVTLASIVQREAAVIDEMPKIAAVYQNRLKRRMRLEADPTVQYAMGMDTGKWFKGLRYKHLDNRSKYNTYMYRGLPPGPICSPGAAAVRAVLFPAEVDYIYFVADNTGGHHFSRTLKEHSAYSKKYKAERQRDSWKKKN
ncbi:MAG: endolytic transglycosylase MltG [Elusimicrobiota bacterium]